MYKRLIIISTMGALAGIVIISINPINSTVLNLAFLLCTVAAWSGSIVLAWNWKPLRIALMIVPVLLAIPFSLPGSAIQESELRDDYVRGMTKLENTKYIWGGESSRGIDCSGLPRRAFRGALIAYGFRHADGGAFRAYLEQWWFDASAKALSEGYRNYTSPIGDKTTIREMNEQYLLPGDLAVTTSGIHVIAYAGEGKWIQADPGIGSVATLNGKTDHNQWFKVPVTLHRWRILSEQ